MAQVDLHTRLFPVSAFNYQTISSDTTVNGNIIDTEFYQSLEFIFQSATITSGTFTPLLQYGDDPTLSDAATVPSDYVIGTIAGATFIAGENNLCKKLGYVGKKRYVRVSEVTTGTASGTLGVAAINGNPAQADIDALT